MVAALNDAGGRGVTGTGAGWCLVLVVWGDKYGAAHINAIVDNVHRHSTSCREVVLMTDRLRTGLDARVRQAVIGDALNRPESIRNYTIKLSLFDPTALPPDTPCVYLDLDTVVTGDLGRLAALVQRPNDLFMLPPGGLLSFGAIRRLLFRLTGGRRMATGNSSVLCFHSGMQPNAATSFLHFRSEGGAPAAVLRNDDLFISWFGQLRLNPVPTSLAVMFRREFLTRSRALSWCRNRLPWVRRRRESIVAVTFNGVEHKLEHLLQLPEGSLHRDSKGRSGYWSRREMGPIKDRIVQAAGGLVGGQ